MFVKLGQMLAARPDLMPPAVLSKLGRLHSQASPLPYAVVEETLAAESGDPAGAFAHIDRRSLEYGLGSASISQAHAGRLPGGEEVVVKVRRPGLVEQVEADLAIVRRLARTAERRTDWGARYRATVLAEEFAAALGEELDFRLEARRAAEFGDAGQSDPADPPGAQFRRGPGDGTARRDPALRDRPAPRRPGGQAPGRCPVCLPGDGDAGRAAVPRRPPIRAT